MSKSELCSTYQLSYGGVPMKTLYLACTMDAPADIAAAALLKHFVSRFGEMPVMTTEAIGYGMGTKEFDAANCLRAFWGQSR